MNGSEGGEKKLPAQPVSGIEVVGGRFEYRGVSHPDPNDPEFYEYDAEEGSITDYSPDFNGNGYPRRPSSG